MNVTNSVFMTTALSVELNSTSNISNNFIMFKNNTFRDYTSYYGEDYFIDIFTKTSSLNVIFNNNKFIENPIDVNNYIQTNGPIIMYMIDQIINLDSQFL